MEEVEVAARGGSKISDAYFNWECKGEKQCNDFSNISVVFFHKQAVSMAPGTSEKCIASDTTCCDLTSKKKCTHVKNGAPNFESKIAFEFQETWSP